MQGTRRPHCRTQKGRPDNLPHLLGDRNTSEGKAFSQASLVSAQNYVRRALNGNDGVTPPNSPLPIRLNREFQADLHWWNLFLEKWNGVSFLLPPAMHLLRCLVYVEARFSFAIVPLYINTKANVLADELSRNNLASFLSKVYT